MAIMMKTRLGSSPAESSQNLTRADAAKYLRISQAHLSNLVRGKVTGVPRLRCAWIGRRMIFKREWLEELVDSMSSRGLQ